MKNFWNKIPTWLRIMIFVILGLGLAYGLLTGVLMGLTWFSLRNL